MLTGREHIQIFSLLRGISSRQAISDTLSQFDLSEHADKLVKTYSGGTKRKLQIALAFIGNPKVVLLDEPSAGLDPSARRSLWNKIISMKEGRAIVLTTHSMEEADALCSTIGILVNGKLKCIGSSQHLKNRFGGGYRISIKTSEHLAKATEDWIMKSFPNAKLLNSLGGTQHFEIPQKNHKLAQMFKEVERNKEKFGIEDYSISQTTLEQVFLNFAKNQL
jgi:ABC-type multidrug transport system ATPase subunit